jgi:broad specificity phosphatase PhoE
MRFQKSIRIAPGIRINLSKSGVGVSVGPKGLKVDGPGCESFADFVARVRQFHRTLCVRGAEGAVVVFTHGLVMQALLWLLQHAAEDVSSKLMADFNSFRRSVHVPNCAVLMASTDEDGEFRCSASVSVAHLPLDLRTA